MIGAGPAIAAVINSYVRKTRQNVRKYKRDSERQDVKLSSEKQSIIDSVNSQFARDNLLSTDRICPECSRNFKLINVNDIQIDICIYCKSLWFDFGELKHLTGLKKDIPSQDLAGRLSEYDCPVCKDKMYRKVFLRKSNLIVDLCKEHGIYLENSELKRALELSAL